MVPLFWNSDGGSKIQVYAYAYVEVHAVVLRGKYKTFLDQSEQLKHTPYAMLSNY